MGGESCVCSASVSSDLPAIYRMVPSCVRSLASFSYNRCIRTRCYPSSDIRGYICRTTSSTDDRAQPREGLLLHEVCGSVPRLEVVRLPSSRSRLHPSQVRVSSARSLRSPSFLCSLREPTRLVSLPVGRFALAVPEGESQWDHPIVHGDPLNMEKDPAKKVGICHFRGRRPLTIHDSR